MQQNLAYLIATTVILNVFGIWKKPTIEKKVLKKHIINTYIITGANNV
jgi:hypothetical protein